MHKKRNLDEIIMIYHETNDINCDSLKKCFMDSCVAGTLEEMIWFLSKDIDLHNKDTAHCMLNATRNKSVSREMVKLLHSNGANINAIRHVPEVNTCLDIFEESMIGGCVDLYPWIEKNGHTAKIYGGKALHHALCAYTTFNYDALKFLVKNGADINYVLNGRTPLMTVIKWANIYIATYPTAINADLQREYLNLCKYLVENGADIHYKNDDGYTAIDLSKGIDLLYEYFLYLNEI